MRPTSRAGMTGVLAGVAYGVGARLAFELTPVGHGVMSFPFLLLVPLAVGVLAVALAGPAVPGTGRAVLLSLAATAGCMAAVRATGLEGSICIVLALPPFVLAAVLGGVIATRVRIRVAGTTARRGMLIGILLLPFAAGALDGRMPARARLRTVETRVRIHAGAADVWRNVVRPTGIRPGENRAGLAHRMGVPRPVTATLSREALGGSRYALFERGVVLRETVMEWMPGRRMAFRIDPANVPRAVLDAHTTIGGRSFDVLDGAYEIVAVAPGEVELRLRTTHRLSTAINPYAGFWTDLLMRQIQQNLLHVIRTRAEAGR